MKIKITDKSLMMIFLLEECNNECPHCVRYDEPMDKGYRLTFEQLRKCLADCRKLESIEWVHFSGGEPTIWKEGDNDLADLLIEISNAGYDPGFTSNGIELYDYDTCSSLFRKYIDNADRTMRLYFSIDTFHRNFDPATGRTKTLDNFLKFQGTLSPKEKDKIKLIVMAVISKDPVSLLPEEMVEHYRSRGVVFSFLPMRSMGKGKLFADIIPDLSSDRPEDLGAYYPYRRERPPKPEDDSDNVVLIGDDYYLHKPEWRVVAKLGELPEEFIKVFRKS